MEGTSVVKNRDNEMLASYVEKIRNEVGKAADSWFNIAYYVYELDYFAYYLNHFSNIVECCQANFGFKKSTTYNFINIVEKFSNPTPTETYGNRLAHIEYADFMERVKNWSYSQLVAMLSLSDKQREQATPDMSARDIKKLKTDSKRLENSETAPAEIVVPAEPEPATGESAPAALAPADVVSKSEYDNIVALLDDSDNLTEKLYEDIYEVNEKYEAERDSNHRLNIKLCDMTAERDKALQDIEEIKEQVKKLKAENKKLKAEIKTLKNLPSQMTLQS